MDPKLQPSGTVPVMNPPPQPPPPTPPGQETVVVPPQGVPVQNNPFVPTGVSPGGARPLSPPGVGGVSQLPRRLLMIFVFLMLLVALGAGGLFVWNLIAGSKEVKLTYWGLWEEESVMHTVIADFEAKNPKIKISYVKQSQQQYRERLTNAINREEGPDVFRFHNTWVPMLKNALSPVPKTVMSPSEFSSTFYPVMASDLVASTIIYGIPLMYDGLGLYINDDMFSRKNATPPTTWEEVLNLIPVLTERVDTTITQSAIALGTTNNVENFSDIMALMFMQNQAHLNNLVGKEAEETLIFYRNFADTNNQYYTWNESLDNSIYAFATGKVAMILAPSWRATEIREMGKGLHFRIVPAPQLFGKNITWASYWAEGVSAKSANQKEAWEFVKYLTSKEGAAKLFSEESKTRLFGEPYARVDLGSSLKDDQYLGAFIKQAPTAKSFPLASRTFDNGLNDHLIQYLQNAVNDVAKGAAPAAALQTANAGFRQVFANYGLVSGSASTGQ